MDRTRQVQDQRAQDVWLAGVEQQLQSLVGRPLFHQWSVSDSLGQLDLNAAFATIQDVAPDWLSLMKRLMHNRFDASSADVAMRTSAFRRQLYTITAMVLRSRARKSANFFRHVLSLYLVGAGALRSVIEVLNGAGLCDSYPAINESWKVVAGQARETVKAMARDAQIVLAYDNFNLLTTVRDQALGSSRPAFVNATTGILVKCLSLPPQGLTINMLNCHHQLSITGILTAQALRMDGIARDNARFFIAQAIKQLYGAAFEKAFTNSPTKVTPPRYHHIRQLAETHATTLHPLAGIYHDEGTIEGTYEVQADIFLKQMGFSSEPDAADFQQRLWLTYGDQKTAAFTRSLMYEQRQSEHHFHRRRWMVGPAALFHTCMALTAMIVRTHFENTPGAESKSTLLHNIRYWGRTGINRENIKYHDVKAVIVDGFNARMLAVIYGVQTSMLVAASVP
ncbi:hypothetical protein KEM52_003018 [Ascosphaera acerosa]|nr:hypothetical protein KEM52_003018 [Ascosphaera acerosa]